MEQEFQNWKVTFRVTGTDETGEVNERLQVCPLSDTVTAWPGHAARNDKFRNI
jgi:hypothetical protein